MRGLDALEGSYPCTNGGQGVMVPLHSDVPSWFNPALQHIIDNGVYENLCAMSSERHGSKCVKEYESLSIYLNNMCITCHLYEFTAVNVVALQTHFNDKFYQAIHIVSFNDISIMENRSQLQFE